MKAIVQTRYGSPDDLRIQDVDKPYMADDAVLVRVHAASVNRADWVVQTGRAILVRLMGYGLRSPKYRIPGSGVAGRIEAVGPSVTRFRPGDDVMAELMNTGLGGFAEFVCVREDRVVLKPSNVTFEEAAAVPIAATTALRGVRDVGAVKAGDRVLINGAAGGVGSFAVQIARALGAHVTGVCSTHSVDLVQALGAECVIDYTRADFTRTDQPYDVIFDLVGNRSFGDLLRALGPTGTVVMGSGNTDQALGPLDRMLTGLVMDRFVSQRIALLGSAEETRDLEAVRELIEAGQVKPALDRCFTLDQVPEALRQHGLGHARGKSVIVATA
jgi:NADPH:quinone reductase-like Zn-dependent oxidoreductase